MNKEETAEWIARKYGDRLTKPVGRPRALWRLDGAIASSSTLWMGLVYPAIEAGEIEIDFQQNVADMQHVFSKVLSKKWEVNHE